MGFCAKIVPLTCKTTSMDPNGSIIAVVQVEGRFFVDFQRKYAYFYILPKIRLKPTKNRPLTCKTAIMDPLGSIIVVLQVRRTSLAQNPIKMAKRKNRPRPNYGPATALYPLELFIFVLSQFENTLDLHFSPLSHFAFKGVLKSQWKVVHQISPRRKVVLPCQSYIVVFLNILTLENQNF